MDAVGFVRFIHEQPSALFPVFKMQQRMRHAIVGEQWWRNLEARFHKQHAHTTRRTVSAEFVDQVIDQLGFYREADQDERMSLRLRGGHVGGAGEPKEGRGGGVSTLNSQCGPPPPPDDALDSETLDWMSTENSVGKRCCAFGVFVCCVGAGFVVEGAVVAVV
jgi:hypothetical protein